MRCLPADVRTGLLWIRFNHIIAETHNKTFNFRYDNKIGYNSDRIKNRFGSLKALIYEQGNG
jgi:hypothetical protein